MSENVTNNFNLPNGGERLARVEQKIEDMMNKIDDLRGALEKLSKAMESRDDTRQGKCEGYRKEFWQEIDGLKAELHKKNVELQTFKAKVMTAAGLISLIGGAVVKYVL